MIILSNSIPKSGSTLIANFQEDILRRSKVRIGQPTLRKYYNGRYIDSSDKKVLMNLFKMDLLNGSLVVKCHWNYSRQLDLFCKLSKVKMTMAFRNPRDMILSMIDHGDKTRNGKDPSGSFADCYNVIDLIPRTVQAMEQLQIWNSKDYTHCIKYEDLMSDQLNVLNEMVAFFRWNVKEESYRNHRITSKIPKNFT